MRKTIITCDLCGKDLEPQDVKAILQVETIKFFGKKGQAMPEHTQSEFCLDCRDKLRKFIDDNKTNKGEESKGE